MTPQNKLKEIKFRAEGYSNVFYAAQDCRWLIARVDQLSCMLERVVAAGPTYSKAAERTIEFAKQVLAADPLGLKEDEK